MRLNFEKQPDAAFLTYNSSFSDGSVTVLTTDNNFLEEAEEYGLVYTSRKSTKYQETGYASSE